MGRLKGAYREEFPTGSNVRIRGQDYLRDFQRRWTLHNPISDEQIAYGGQIDVVVSVSFYHGGDELYRLKTAPGVWHEELLEAT